MVCHKITVLKHIQKNCLSQLQPSSENIMVQMSLIDYGQIMNQISQKHKTFGGHRELFHTFHILG
jgi:hypothetical protein